MYILAIVELETIIFSYLDQIIDWNRLRQTNSYYKDLLNNDVLQKDDSFKLCCILNDLKSSDIHAENEYAFYNSCVEGHLDVIKWLWEASQETIDIHVNDDSTFKESCWCGSLDMVEWLFQICNEKVNIVNDIDNILKRHTKSNNLDMIDWINKNYDKLKSDYHYDK